jgi:hypothetical protein
VGIGLGEGVILGTGLGVESEYVGMGGNSISVVSAQDASSRTEHNIAKASAILRITSIIM